MRSEAVHFHLLSYLLGVVRSREATIYHLHKNTLSLYILYSWRMTKGVTGLKQYDQIQRIVVKKKRGREEIAWMHIYHHISEYNPTEKSQSDHNGEFW